MKSRPTKSLLVLFLCLFVVMLGFGITLPVLPFFVERLALQGGGREAVALHVGGLASAYALAQLVFSPLWGRFADAYGRRRAVLIGLGGFGLSQLAFGLATGLPALYLARLLAGTSSACVLPAAAAYVADSSSSARRTEAMGRMNASLSLGVVAGPALGSLLAREDFHFRSEWGHLVLNGFSIPFLAAAALAVATLGMAYRWLDEPEWRRSATRPEVGPVSDVGLARRLVDLLLIVVASQFALALFESTFALFAAEKLGTGLQLIGYAFVVCGLVMAVVQGGVTGWLGRWVPQEVLIAGGVVTAAIGLFGLGSPGVFWHALAAVGVFALGLAVAAPSLLALIAGRARGREGAALGLQGAAASLGQVTGPVVGGWLLVWSPELLYRAGGTLLLAVGLLVTLKARLTLRGASK